jgi:hypothetical protein
MEIRLAGLKARGFARKGRRRRLISVRSCKGRYDWERAQHNGVIPNRLPGCGVRCTLAVNRVAESSIYTNWHTRVRWWSCITGIIPE